MLLESRSWSWPMHVWLLLWNNNREKCVHPVNPEIGERVQVKCAQLPFSSNNEMSVSPLGVSRNYQVGRGFIFWAQARIFGAEMIPRNRSISKTYKICVIFFDLRKFIIRWRLHKFNVLKCETHSTWLQKSQQNDYH